MKNKIIKEIEELHKFFENYFKGTIPQDDISRFVGVLHDKFQLITPLGDLINKDVIIKTIENSFNSTGEIKLWTEFIGFDELENDYIRANYYELQKRGLEQTKRISTVLFKLDESTPNGLTWVLVHETWV